MGDLPFASRGHSSDPPVPRARGTPRGRGPRQLLALYEHRAAVQGWLWDINPYDQWGVHLGKAFAAEVRGYLAEARGKGGEPTKFLPGTAKLLKKYLGR